jgi:hypothetical protein
MVLSVSTDKFVPFKNPAALAPPTWSDPSARNTNHSSICFDSGNVGIQSLSDGIDESVSRLAAVCTGGGWAWISVGWAACAGGYCAGG